MTDLPLLDRYPRTAFGLGRLLAALDYQIAYLEKRPGRGRSLKS